MDPGPGLYRIRINGRLGATALSAFPAMVSQLEGGETVLTGLLADRSAVFGVIGEIEALGLDLLELRRLLPRAKSPSSGEALSPDHGCCRPHAGNHDGANSG